MIASGGLTGLRNPWRRNVSEWFIGTCPRECGEFEKLNAAVLRKSSPLLLSRHSILSIQLRTRKFHPKVKVSPSISRYLVDIRCIHLFSRNSVPRIRLFTAYAWVWTFGFLFGEREKEAWEKWIESLRFSNIFPIPDNIFSFIRHFAAQRWRIIPF